MTDDMTEWLVSSCEHADSEPLNRETIDDECTINQRVSAQEAPMMVHDVVHSGECDVRDHGVDAMETWARRSVAKRRSTSIWSVCRS